MNHSSLRLHLCSSVFICGFLLFLPGCRTSEETKSQARLEQDRALKDPFGYGPDAQKMSKEMQRPDDDVDPTDVSGGDTATLNKKAMKRDLDRVFGP